MTAIALLALCILWLIDKGPRNAEHRPRLLALMGERHTVGVTWRCVETGFRAPYLCGCIGCREHLKTCFPDALTWRDTELAWFRHANKAR